MGPPWPYRRNLILELQLKKHNSKKVMKMYKNNFPHPSDNSLKIFVFADVPHLIKLLRNNLFNSGFIVDDKTLEKSLLEELLGLNSNNLKIAFNLTKAHLDAKGFQRQRVLLAAQVFSMMNAKALEYCRKKRIS